MTQFEIWKIAADIGLLGSLIYFSYRFLIGQSPVDTFQLRELQGGLRNAIKEADQAGKGLNEQLIQRKQNLERLLIEIESAESRISRVINSAEEKKGDLEFEISRAKQARSEISRNAAVTNIPVSNIPVSNVAVAKEDLLAVDPAIKELSVGIDEFAEAVNPSRTNIFGEPIEENTSTYQPPINQPARTSRDLEKAFGDTPLTVQIEKQVEIAAPAPEKSRKSPVLSLEEVYSEAEDMLRAGKALEEVSKQTHLTSDEVRLLAQMVESEMASAGAEQAEEENVSRQDNRLGVLGGGKRQPDLF